MTIELSASYSLLDDLHASLVLESDQHRGIVLSVLHERYSREPVCYDFAGHESQQIEVVAGESLTIVVRCQGRIIAALVNEVDCCESNRLLLHPKGGYNLLIHQSRLDTLPPRYPDSTSVLDEMTPTTIRLAESLEIVRQQQTVPQDLREFLPVVCEALTINEEDHSQSLADLLCQTLTGLDLEAKIQAVLH